METVFAILLVFSDFDDCWNFYHDNNLEPLAAEACIESTQPVASAAPETSLRPKVRPADLMG